MATFKDHRESYMSNISSYSGVISDAVPITFHSKAELDLVYPDEEFKTPMSSPTKETPDNRRSVASNNSYIATTNAAAPVVALHHVDDNGDEDLSSPPKDITTVSNYDSSEEEQEIFYDDEADLKRRKREVSSHESSPASSPVNEYEDTRKSKRYSSIVSYVPAKNVTMPSNGSSNGSFYTVGSHNQSGAYSSSVLAGESLKSPVKSSGRISMSGPGDWDQKDLQTLKDLPDHIEEPLPVLNPGYKLETLNAQTSTTKGSNRINLPMPIPVSVQQNDEEISSNDGIVVPDILDDVSFTSLDNKTMLNTLRNSDLRSLNEENNRNSKAFTIKSVMSEENDKTNSVSEVSMSSTRNLNYELRPPAHDTMIQNDLDLTDDEQITNLINEMRLKNSNDHKKYRRDSAAVPRSDSFGSSSFRSGAYRDDSVMTVQEKPATIVDKRASTFDSSTRKNSIVGSINTERKVSLDPKIAGNIELVSSSRTNIGQNHHQRYKSDAMDDIELQIPKRKISDFHALEHKISDSQLAARQISIGSNNTIIDDDATSHLDHRKSSRHTSRQSSRQTSLQSSRQTSRKTSVPTSRQASLPQDTSKDGSETKSGTDIVRNPSLANETPLVIRKRVSRPLPTPPSVCSGVSPDTRASIQDLAAEVEREISELTDDKELAASGATAAVSGVSLGATAIGAAQATAAPSESLPKQRKKKSKKKLSSGKVKPYDYTAVSKLLEATEGAAIGEEFNEIALPFNEKKMLDKIVDSLSRLTAEMIAHPSKYDEGLERLNKAFRALEGKD